MPRKKNSTTNPKPDSQKVTPSAEPANPKPVSDPQAGEPTRSKYLIAGMYDHPYFAGIAMPPGTALNGFVTVTITEKEVGEGITQKQALAAVKRKITAQNKRQVENITVTAVSLLPATW